MSFRRRSDAVGCRSFFVGSNQPLLLENQYVKPRVRAEPDKPLGFDALALSHRILATNCDSVGIVHNAVAYGVSNGCFANFLIPTRPPRIVSKILLLPVCAVLPRFQANLGLHFL